jgi:hypothetical protein
MTFDPVILATVGIIAALVLLACCAVMYFLYLESVRTTQASNLVKLVHNRISLQLKFIIKFQGGIEYSEVLSIIHGVARQYSMLEINAKRDEQGVYVITTFGVITSEIFILNNQVSFSTEG